MLVDTWRSGEEAGSDQAGALTLLRGAGWGVTVANPELPMNRVWANLCRTGLKRDDTMIAGAGQ